MTKPAWNVRTFCPDSVRRKHALTLSSLPLSFTVDEAGTIDVALVGSGDDHIESGIAAKPKIIVLDRPARVSASGIQTLLESGIPVLPVLEVAPTLRRCKANLVLGDVMLVRSSLSSRAERQDGRLEHLLALEAVLGPLSDIKILQDTGEAYFGSGRLENGTARVLWNGQTGTNDDRFSLDVIAMAQRLEVDVAFAPAARPAGIRLADRDGTRQLRGIYETGLRLFWREVAAELTEEGGKALPLAAAAVHLANTTIF